MDSSAARTFLAIALSMAVILLWQMYIAKTHPPRMLDASYSDASDNSLPNQTEEKSSTDEVKASDDSNKVNKNEPSDGSAIEYEEKTVSLSNNLFNAVFTNRGGRLKEFTLKKYYLPHAKDKNVNLVHDSSDTLSFLLNNKLYRFSGDDRYDFISVSERQLVLEFLHPDGILITKEYSIVGDYELALKITVTNKSEKEFTFKPELVLSDYALKGGLGTNELKSSLMEYYYPLCLANESLLDGLELKKGPISKSQEGSIGWIASTSRYFISAVIPVEQKVSLCRFSSNNNYYFTASLLYPERKIEKGNKTTISYRLYFGPKGYSMLKKVGSDLNRSVDFGWLAVLCIPLLYLLNLFNSFVHNYGISIIILTVIVKLISIPFTQKSMKSMQELQKIKPKMDEIQKKYKDNKEKLNEEMMRLYREHGVSPFGGCLPMILQMPIWFALYRMLSNSVELYQAAFIPGWINDLSSKDPYYILPVLLGVGTYLQQRLTPSTMDSTQAKVMLYFMPIFLTFIMISLPSGLTLYIFVSSILSIIHQIYMNKTGQSNQINKNQTKSLREEQK
ncbi:MAG: membrane protein insertase YidC [Myxococcota bacterium]